jgi:PAS domain S-box-containing protein
MKVLIVENNPTERALLEEQIYLLGHEVTACVTAKIALEYYQKTCYSLIVVALRLPDMDGVEFCRQIRSLPQREPSMILAITSHDEPEKLQAAIEAGADDYLIKPIDPNLLKLRLMIIERQIQCLAKHLEAEEALRASQTYAGNIIESSLDMIIAVDLDRYIVEFNKAAQKTFGYRLEEVLGRHVDILYADKTEALNISQTTLEQGQCIREIFNIRENGEIFPCLLCASILRDAYGKPIGIMGISRDITEQKRVEEALRVSQEYATNIIESSLDMIIAVDMERRIVEFNKAAQETFGYHPEEVLGKHVNMLYADETESSATSLATTEQGQCVREIHNKRKNGEIFPCLLSASILQDGQGDPVGFMGISRDITKRKQSEEALKKAHAELERQNVELTRASKLKDEFLSVMSHELRTPLTAILCQWELLQEKLYGTLNNRQLAAVESIGESSHQLLALINDILDFSKISQGKLELEIAPVPVETLCQASLQAITQQARKKHLKISLMVDKNVMTIQADESRLKQVLLNLLGNAVKFTHKSGEVGLEVQGDTEQRIVRFTVWDTGIGIAEEDKERLFQPFVQLDSSLSREYTGAGLGLSMVCHIVNMHGGSISVESEVGKGSRFTVSLPWKTTDASTTHIEDYQPQSADLESSAV